MVLMRKLHIRRDEPRERPQILVPLPDNPGPLHLVPVFLDSVRDYELVDHDPGLFLFQRQMVFAAPNPGLLALEGQDGLLSTDADPGLPGVEPRHKVVQNVQRPHDGRVAKAVEIPWRLAPSM